MSARKQTVSFTEPAFAYARNLVEAGEYPSISAAVSGEMVRARAARDARAALLAAEVERRLALQPEQWEPVGELSEITGEARDRLAGLRRRQGTHPAEDAPRPSPARPPGRDGDFDHVLETTRGDLAAAERRLDEIDDLLRTIAADPTSGVRLDGLLAGWRMRHGGRGRMITVVFRADAGAGVLRIAMIAFGGRNWLEAARDRR